MIHCHNSLLQAKELEHLEGYTRLQDLHIADTFYEPLDSWSRQRLKRSLPVLKFMFFSHHELESDEEDAQ